MAGGAPLLHRVLEAHSMAYAGKEDGEHGDKCFLPSSMFALITKAKVPLPLLFAVGKGEVSGAKRGRNAPPSAPALRTSGGAPTRRLGRASTITEKSLLVGVSEFTAPAGLVYLPFRVMTWLGVAEGGAVTVVLVPPGTVPQGKVVRFRPHSSALTGVLAALGAQAFMEGALKRYSALTAGTTLSVVDPAGNPHSLDILAVSAVSEGADAASTAVMRFTAKRSRAPAGPDSALAALTPLLPSTLTPSRGKRSQQGSAAAPVQTCAADGTPIAPVPAVTLYGSVDLEVDFAPPRDVALPSAPAKPAGTTTPSTTSVVSRLHSTVGSARAASEAGYTAAAHAAAAQGGDDVMFRVPVSLPLPEEAAPATPEASSATGAGGVGGHVLGRGTWNTQPGTPDSPPPVGNTSPKGLDTPPDLAQIRARQAAAWAAAQGRGEGGSSSHPPRPQVDTSPPIYPTRRRSRTASVMSAQRENTGGSVPGSPSETPALGIPVADGGALRRGAAGDSLQASGHGSLESPGVRARRRRSEGGFLPYPGGEADVEEGGEGLLGPPARPAYQPPPTGRAIRLSSQDRSVSAPYTTAKSISPPRGIESLSLGPDLTEEDESSGERDSSGDSDTTDGVMAALLAESPSLSRVNPASVIRLEGAPTPKNPPYTPLPTADCGQGTLPPTTVPSTSLVSAGSLTPRGEPPASASSTVSNPKALPGSEEHHVAVPPRTKAPSPRDRASPRMPPRHR